MHIPLKSVFLYSHKEFLFVSPQRARSGHSNTQESRMTERVRIHYGPLRERRADYRDTPLFEAGKTEMNKIEIKCYINGENALGSSSLYLSRTESWEQVLYKISLKVNKVQGSNPRVYNEMGVEVSSIADLEDGDKVFFEANGGPFVPPATCTAS